MGLRKAKSAESRGQDYNYAIAYSYEARQVGTVGLGAFFANDPTKQNGMVAGELVRIACQSGDEVHYRDNGVIFINRSFPSTEGMNLRERAMNRVAKMLVGFVGESNTVTYRPIPDSELPLEALEQLRQANRAFQQVSVSTT